MSDMPFSEAVRSNGFLILSGQIPTLPGTSEVAAGGIEGQSRQVMDNIKRALERHGSSLDKVVKCTVMIDSMKCTCSTSPGPSPRAARLALTVWRSVRCSKSSAGPRIEAQLPGSDE
jgi:enamine deaminase RidA (YjgF/YER057c/UK114 family)